MYRTVWNAALAVSVLAMTAAPAAAQSGSWLWNLLRPPSTSPSPSPTPAAVPEIDASTGLLAVAAVLAVMALVWERRRRRAA